MQLSQVRLVGVGPFEDLTVPLSDDAGALRRLTVVLGAGGVGKTSLLAAIASTRPGSAVPVRPRPAAVGPSFVVADWVLGDDDPARPHPLRVASPNAVLEEREDEAVLRRREQALFDRRATEGGHVLVGFSAVRALPRTPLSLAAGERAAVGRYDPRAPVTFDDATRADVARETKQALSVASIRSSLGGSAVLHLALCDVVTELGSLVGCTYEGADPVTFEPMFDTGGAAPTAFDELPASARSTLAFGVLTTRALHAAYPSRPPRESEGVVLIDEVELHQEPEAARAIVPTLTRLFPRVQWIVSTQQPAVALACDSEDVFALRRMPSSHRVELFAGTIH
jgi:hypothetical protein